MTAKIILCCWVLMLALASPPAAGMLTVEVSSATELQELLAEPVDSVDIFLEGLRADGPATQQGTAP